MTAVASTAFTAAQFNQYVRDNLNETAPAKATAASRIFVSTGANAIAERVITEATTATSETTTSTSYGDLSGGATGPAITITTGIRALVWITAQMSNSVGGNHSWMSVAVTGASAVSASDPNAAMLESSAANDEARIGVALLLSLSAGSNTFTMKYRVDAGTGTFVRRNLIVMAL
jgi:hypothetical protein